MRIALRSASARSRLAAARGAGRAILTGATIPAPYKGWNANAPLENMDPASAILLDNFFPEPAYVRLRRGYSAHATGMGSGNVESLFAWRGASGTQKLFAACGTSIFNASNIGPVGTADITGLSNARFQHTHQTTSGGNFLFIVNGADAPRYYDGTNWTTPSITGITATDAIHCNVHQRRIWLTLRNSTKAAYLPVDAVAGAAQVFDLGPLFSKGGYLVGMGTWTVDAGNGSDDLAVFISSQGQAAIYAGTDPAQASTWALKGVFDLGPPIGRRCFTRAGNDLAVITVDGVVPLSRAIVLDRVATRRFAVTGSIQRAMNDAARLWRHNFGWQLISYPLGSAVKLNVPAQQDVSYQYVLNPATGAWCRYTGMNAYVWELFNDKPYFGGSGGKVFAADSGSLDDGQPIRAQLRTAFNHFNARGQIKTFSLIRPLITGSASVQPTLAINTDYSDKPEPELIAAAATGGGMIWNQFQWNDGSLWGGGFTSSSDWFACSGVGDCASVNLKLSAQPQTEIDIRITGFEIRYETGSGI